jgi:hypothetical protein
LFLNRTKKFLFETETPLPSITHPYLQCRIGNQVFPATVKNSKDVECEVTITKDDQLTLWYSANRTFVISSNSIRLTYFGNFIFLILESSNISYNFASDQFGYTQNLNDIFVNLNPIALISYQSRVLCSLGPNVKTNTFFIPKNVFKCSMNLDEDNVYNVSLLFSYPNAFKLDSKKGVFDEKINVEIKQNMNVGNTIKITIDTKTLIETNKLKNDCSDMIVTFKNQEINRKLLPCNNLQSNLIFEIQENILEGKSPDYSIYYSNGNHSSFNTNGISNNGVENIDIVPVPNQMLKLSTNDLIYRAVPRVNILNIQPQISLLKPTNITIFSNIAIKQLNLLDYQITDGKQNFSATMGSNQFKAVISSPISQVLNLGIFAIYKPTGKSLLITNSNVPFYFWNSTVMKSLDPSIVSFNSTTTNIKRTVSIVTDTTLLSDVGLNCNIFYKGVKTLSKSTKISSNLLNCDFDLKNLTMNTELILVGLSLNETLGEITLTSNNLTQVYLREPISLSGIPKTILLNNYMNNFTINFDDVRKSNAVSFTNYSIVMTPEYHSSTILNCYFDSINPKCLIPSLVLNYVPVRLNFQMKVYSALNNKEDTFQMDFAYHKENVSILQEYPFLIDIESYQLKPVTVLFNVTKRLSPLYSFYCNCNFFILNL